MINALIIDEKDDVAVAIEEIKNGTEGNFRLKNGIKTVKVAGDIPIYHKFALNDIPKGVAVIKYGEHIGVATVDIKKGEHVHVHNVKSEKN